MKRIIIVIAVLVCSLAAKAQDIIVTRDAERIDAVVEEVSETQVKYKRKGNLDGPTFVLSTSKIATIIYKNGTVQTFEQQAQPQQPTYTTPSSTSSNTGTLRDIARVQEEKEVHVPTPAEGPWLLWGVQLKEGVSMYFDAVERYKLTFGVRCLPSIEGYVEFAPKQEDMAEKRHSVYLGMQYTFRGAMTCSGVRGEPKLDLQYLCIRPAYSMERKAFYSHTGFELGILTRGALVYEDGSSNGIYESCNKATFGLWQEFGWVIKDHFNIGVSLDYIMSNSTKNVWVDADSNEHLYGYSPQLQLQLVFGYKFNPYKLDKKKIEPITL